MLIYKALTHMRKGKIARCKRSFFAIDEDGNLVRINRDKLTIKGIATLSGRAFATDKWWLLNERPVKEKE